MERSGQSLHGHYIQRILWHRLGPHLNDETHIRHSLSFTY